MRFVNEAGRVVAQISGERRPRYGTEYFASVCLPGQAQQSRWSRNCHELDAWVRATLTAAGVSWRLAAGKIDIEDAGL